MTTYYNYLGQAMAVSGNPTSSVTGTGSGATGQTIYAPEGNVQVSVGGSTNATIVGAAGNQVYIVNNSLNHVQVPDSAAAGVKTIVSYSGGYILPDNVENLTFWGAASWGVGNSLDNLIIMGGNDQNYMDGGAGNDVLVGGFGQNNIGFSVGGGHDVFYNFHANLDTVRITGANFASFAQIQAAMTQVGTDVVLTVSPNDSILFRNITIADFTPQNFLLPLDRSLLGDLTFHDEFDSMQLYDASTGQGQWQTNFVGDPTQVDTYTISSNGEKQIYTDAKFQGTSDHALGLDPFSIQDGILTITASKIPSSVSSYTWGQSYYSGMLNTKGLFLQKYGYFEMRAELPTELGSWPAFWLAQDPYKPGIEADVLEHLALYPDVNFGRVVDGGKLSASTNVMVGLSGFHTYGMLWSPTVTSFYIDDVAIMTVATPASWDKPMYMLLNLAVGGWGGPIDGAAYPAEMKVDYVRVYGLADGSEVVSQPAGELEPVPPPPPPGGSVSTSASVYVAPADIQFITLTGSHQTVTANDRGDTITSNNGANRLIGGAGADTFIVGRSGDTVTGNGGADVYVFRETPWTGATLTQLDASDRIDLAGLLAKSGYSGSNPLADGYIKIDQDAAGNARIWSNLDKVSAGLGWWLIATVQGVGAGSLQVQGSTIVLGSGATTPPPPPPPPPPGTGDTVSTSAAAYTAPDGVRFITLTGSNQTVTANNLGDTITSNDKHNTLIGGTGADTFYIGRNGDTVTGGAGADVFAFKETPWSGATITDFAKAQDVVDLRGLLAKSGYAGANAIGDGYIKIQNDSAGHAQIWSNLDKVSAGLGWWLVATLNLGASDLSYQNGYVVGSGASAPTSPTDPTPSGTATVSTNAATYVAPDGVKTITLTGSHQTVTANNLGDTIVSNNTGNQLIGGSGADTFIIGRGGDVVTGKGGADVFTFKETPWGAATITDFASGQDHIDVTGLLTKSGFTGTDPLAEGYLRVDAISGGARILSNLDHVQAGAGWFAVATVSGTAPADLHLSHTAQGWFLG